MTITVLSEMGSFFIWILIQLSLLNLFWVIGFVDYTRIILLSYHHFINEEIRAQGSPKSA